MEPVSAIVLAVTGALGGVFDMVSAKEARKQAYQEWLNSGMPQYTDAFANYKTPTSRNNLFIMGILGLLIVVVIVALMLRKKQT